MTNSLEAKIVVLGGQGVGKTSIVNRYIYNTFEPENVRSTVGASFVTKRVVDTTSDTVIRLQIWDTAGQERFRSISKLYYRGANAGLLCYDITDEASFHEMAGWLVELKENMSSNDPPIVIHVVGTKADVVADDPTKRKVPFERTIAYVAEQLYPSQASTPPPSSNYVHSTSPPTTNGYGPNQNQIPESKRSSGFWGQDIGWDCCHEVSAKDGEGIEEVFRVITRKLVEQKNKEVDSHPWNVSPRTAGGSRKHYPEGQLVGDAANADKRRSWRFKQHGNNGIASNDEGTVDVSAAVNQMTKKNACC